MGKETKEVFEAVIHIGEDPVHFRGGIGAVLAVYKKYFPAFRAIGTHRHISGIGKILFFGKNYLYFIWVLLFSRKIKIIHIHGSYGASVIRKSIVAFTAKTFFRKKVIYHIHSSEYNLKYQAGPVIYKELCDYLLHKSDKIGCLTPKWKELFSRQFGIKKGTVMINMIDPPQFQIEDKIPHVPGNPIRFLFLGLIHEKKGIFDLVEIVKQNKPLLEGKVIFHIGGIGKVSELKTLIQENQLEEIIDYRGWIDEVGKAKLFLETDIFILPSYNEGLPICILEAMSYAVPVLATNVGGIPEIMSHNENGFLFEKGDKEAMLRFILNYVNDPSIIESQGKKSFDLVQRFYPEQVVPQIEIIYRSLLEI
jgi:glycosyltransferase involved in cell wall biosynthesis